MTNLSKFFGPVHAVGALIVLTALGTARPAHASPTYPTPLGEAIAMQYAADPTVVKCVPACNGCHLTLAGGPAMLNSFGTGLKANGLTGFSQTALIAPALQKYAMADPAAVTTAIEGFCGAGAAIPQYGCGARIATAPPEDRFGLLFAGLAVFGLAVAQRRRTAARARRTRSQ